MSRPWWRGAVIYQIYPRSFLDTNGDGIGDLRGIADKLAYVASLGVDGVWISPFFVSPMADFGYDVADYTAVDPMFGDMADFDHLLGEAHRLGLKVLIDLVLAHTSDQHPWFAESRISRDNPKADWYLWHDPRPDGSPPNNWLSVFGGGAWTWEPRRRQYFLHHFLPAQPALNVRQPAVVDALMEAARFWLAKGVDGFRLDAVDFMAHDETMADNPARPEGGTAVRPFNMQSHLYDMADPCTLDVLERLRAVLADHPGTATIAEIGSEDCREPALVRAETYTRGHRLAHKAYTLKLMKGAGDAAHLDGAIAEVERVVNDGWFCWAFSNHDVERVASRWGDGSSAAARLFLALLLTLRGSVCLYQGEELGLAEAEVPYEALQDPYGKTYWPAFKGRDGSRTPMPWRAGAPHGGFSGAARPWLPLPASHLEQAVDTQDGDDGSVLAACRALLAWRRSRPCLIEGSLKRLGLAAPLLGFVRQGEDGAVACIFNLSAAPAPAPEAPGRSIAVPGFATGDDPRTIEAWGARFFEA